MQASAQLLAPPSVQELAHRSVNPSESELALLSAHLDETEDEPLRADLRELRREVLQRLMAISQAADNGQEAELYALMLDEE